MSSTSTAPALRRSGRAVRTVCWCILCAGFAALIAAPLLGAVVPDWLPTLALVFGLLFLLIGGLPLAVMALSDWMRTTTTVHEVRPGLEAWATSHGLRLQQRVGKDEQPHSAMLVHRALQQLDAELGLASHLPKHWRPSLVLDQVTGEGPDAPVVFTLQGMRAPELLRRIVAIPHDADLGAMSIVDARLDALWRSKDQRVESVELDDRWRMRAKFRERAHQLVHPRVAQTFANAPAHLERLDIAPGWIVGWLAPETSAGDLERSLEVLRRTRELVPRYLQG